MRAVNAAAAGFGVAFGFLISWGQFTDPDRIRQMLLLEDPYLYLMMFSTIAIAGAGVLLLRRRRARALLTGAPVVVERTRPERRHVVGAAIFALGWSVADSCPAPIAAQLTQGVWWSLFTIGGVLLGIELHARFDERRRRSPAPRARPANRPLVALRR